jgi:hypothetical protein
MTPTLWLPVISLAITTVALRWYFGRQPRPQERASTLRWVLVCIGCALTIHGRIDAQAGRAVATFMTASGTVLAIALLLFPSLTIRFLDLFETQ